MQYFKQLWKPFLNKEKALIIFALFTLLNISLYIVFQNSLFSQKGYNKAYPNAGLEFFYYIHSIGINPYHFICMMLFIPNLVSCDFLTMNISHTHYAIEQRISKKSYYQHTILINMIMTFLTVLGIEVLLLGIIHIFYTPIHFNTMNYPPLYHAITCLINSNEIYNLIIFLFITSLGYALVSTLIFSFQMFMTNPYVYRCSGVIIGILLVLLPAFIQGFIPWTNAAFLLQINNLVCLGIEGVRDNPFGLSHIQVYVVAFIIYTLITILFNNVMYQWRKRYD